MLVLLVLIGLGASAAADELLMARITQLFPEAMSNLQETIRAKAMWCHVCSAWTWG